VAKQKCKAEEKDLSPNETSEPSPEVEGKKWKVTDAAEPWVQVQGVVEALFGEVEKDRHGGISYTYEGVTFDYVNIGSMWHSVFGGILLKADDMNYKSVVRKVLPKNNEIDLVKVREKFEELKALSKRGRELRDAKYDAQEQIRVEVQNLKTETEIEYPDSLNSDFGKFKLTLGGLTAEQVKAVMTEVKKIRESKEARE